MKDVANAELKVEDNTVGEFFVDTTCINCDTCRQLAPDNFKENDHGFSFVYEQPKTEDQIDLCMQAVIACPTGSIGHGDSRSRREYRSAFPKLLDNNLYYLGYHSPKSYGGASYLVTLNKGSWMVDAPRYSTYLRDQIEELGGIRYIFLTHQDDVADAEKYAEYFGSERIIHSKDRHASPGAEIIIRGTEDKILQKPFVIIPTPGHTRGHMCLLFDSKYLFTGDHLNWNRQWNGLRASRRMNWFSWKKQKESLELLADYEFNWVLPGHGQRKNLEKEKMHKELMILLDKIEDDDYW